MFDISKPVIKKDHYEKVNGSAIYIADMSKADMLHGKFLRSVKAKAKIIEIKLPALPDGYCIVDYKAVPGVNRVAIIVNDQPIYAEDQVNYIGEAILMVVGPDSSVIDGILKEIIVVYEEEDAIFDIDHVAEYACSYSYQKGDINNAFTLAAKVIEETFVTGYQEHVYIEPNGIIAEYKDGKISVYGSMQCPYYVKGAIRQAMGLPDNQVQIVQTTTGGAFGGKEDYPSVLGAQVAVAAYRAGKPVRVIFDRREDMSVTTKRHPAKIMIKTALDEQYHVIGISVDITFNGGAYAGLSSVVLQRAMLAALGVYQFPNLKVNGRVAITNTVPTGAFRGFGGPQSEFAIETHMSHLAQIAGKEALAYKAEHFVKQGEETPTGGKFYDPIKLGEMVAKAESLSDYSNKRIEYSKLRGRMRKGIGMSIFLHGCGFTGSAERDHIKAKVKLEKKEDNSIEILVSNTDMGQGLKTTLSKIVAKVLELPLEKIKMVNPDTDRVPDSGPTVASRSVMTVGKLLERAAIRLKNEWKDGEYQAFEEDYVHPDLIPWDIKTFTGDAYPTYSWGINVVEVEVDTLTATTEITGTWGVFDLGTAIDDTIIRGQMEGGMLQGLGYGSMENMTELNGFIRQNSITDYIIPTAMDTPKIETALIYNPYSGGPFGAKGAGELTLIGTAPAYVAAVEHAAQVKANKIPFLPEDLMQRMDEKPTKKEA
ncbi:MAG: xanthine dehydrogenase family protein [Lachnospiraceae bacterium]|jgi:CO/xanthine dehydrogenase Mo-binding subunit|nr:xanthine dehydrogenase family protein [Lachnospiraceae bacterium]